MHVVDSHTEGEPTRLVMAGGPDLGSGSMAERRARFARDFDHVRSAVVCEPRGFDALVGALLCAPVDRTCAAGLIFFNNAGYLGMCGHATIGAAVTLARLGRIDLGRHRFETPVGVVGVELLTANEARVENVPSYRHLKGVTVTVEGLGPISGDVAWGGNWFFLTKGVTLDLDPKNIAALTRSAEAVRKSLAETGITGACGAEIDHVEFFAAPRAPGADARNFVLCPGGAYDRSPCGTGTSAKLACLAADGELAPGAVWIQESIIGSRFAARYRLSKEGADMPEITGRAYVVSEAELSFDAADPFVNGIAPPSLRPRPRPEA